MLRKGKRDGVRDKEVSICSCSPPWHDEIAPYLLSWESPRTLKRSEKGVTPLLPSLPGEAVGNGACAGGRPRARTGAQESELAV